MYEGVALQGNFEYAFIAINIMAFVKFDTSKLLQEHLICASLPARSI